MALTETQENDKIEVVNKWNIQVRNATIIKKDGVELTRSFNRKTLTPGALKGGDGSDKDDLVETDISGEDSDVQRHCNAAWTDQVKADYKAFLIANKPST
tara:strand:+ start:176 stop:475 length:300 start_codon:yes stop_codon:yes gene_type:complete